MIPTSQDVAKLAGVSRSTVSQILNGRSGLFTEDTRARVTQAIAELGYEPSLAGRTLARGSSDIIIALIPDTTFGRNLQDIYGALTDELSERGLTLVLRLSTPTPESLDKLLMGLKPRAVLTLTALPANQRALLLRRGIEVLEPDESEDADINVRIGTMQALHLIKRGYQNLAYAHLRDSRSDLFGDPRERAFAATCQARGLHAPAVLHLGISLSEGLDALDQLARKGVAIACYNDDVATTLLAAARKKRWAVPKDLALVGMDNTPLAALTSPPLTTIGYDPTQATRESMQSLLARLDKRGDRANSFELHMELMQGETT